MTTVSKMRLPRTVAGILGMIAFVLALLTLLPAAEHAAASGPEAAGLFNGAMADLQAGEYALARIKCQDILRHYPDASVAPQTQLVLAYSLYRLQEYALAGKKCGAFLKQYGSSPYVGYARYLSAKILFKQGNKDESLDRLVALLKDGAGSGLDKRIRGLFTDVTFTGNADEDAKLLTGLFAGAERSGKAEPGGNTVTIGLLCPLTGEWAAVGESFMNGAVFCVTEYNRDSHRKIRLVVEDTRGDLLTTVAAARRLIEEEKVTALVGPLMSNTTIAAAGVAQICGVPLVSPTASRYGIAAVGDHIFQANVPSRVQGRLIADFAVRELGMRTFAVLAPFDTYGKGAARGFEERIAELEDATLVGREWYYEGASDFSAQFEKIRRRELIKTLNLLDVEKDTDVEELARGEDNPDTKMLVPITSIDALFVPSYADEVPLVASQVAFNNIEAVLLGGDKWNTKEILKSRKYLQGTVFPCVIRKDRTSSKFLAFTRRYRAAHQDGTPDDIALLAYDGMSLVTTAVKGGAKTRKAVTKALTDVKEFDGVARKMRFVSGEGHNGHLDFMMVRDGRIVPFERAKYRSE